MRQRAQRIEKSGAGRVQTSSGLPEAALMPLMHAFAVVGRYMWVRAHGLSALLHQQAIGL